MLEYEDYTKFQPFPGAPRFFRYAWNPGPPGLSEGMIGDRKVTIFTPPTPPGGLIIYGYSARSSYPEDHGAEDSAFQRNRTFPGICFSEVEQEGEYGFTPLDAVEEITEEEFLAARARGYVSERNS